MVVARIVVVPKMNAVNMSEADTSREVSRTWGERERKGRNELNIGIDCHSNIKPPFRQSPKFANDFEIKALLPLHVILQSMHRGRTT